MGPMQDGMHERAFLALVERRHLRPPRNGFLDRTLRDLAAFFAATALRDAIARRPGFVQRVHPQARLLAVLCFLLSVSLASSITVLAVHAILVAAATRMARIRVRELLGAGLLIACIFSLLMALPAALNLVSGGDVVLPLVRLSAPRDLGPVRMPAAIGVSREGLRTAGTFLLRTVASTAAVLNRSS